MRQLLVFLALLLMGGSTALAQDNIKVYGVIRSFIDSDRIGHADPGTRVSSFISKIGFQATETIDRDLRLNFIAETALWPDNGRRVPAYLGDERITVGVENASFSLDVGRAQHSTWAALKRYNWITDLYGTFAGEIHSRQGLRFNNGVFVTWKPTSTTTLRADTSMSEAAGVSNSYSFGVTQQLTTWAEIGTSYYTNNLDARTMLVGVRLNMPDDRTVLYGTFTQDQVANVQRNGYSAGATYAVTERLSINGGVGVRSDDVRAAGAGADYALSKRTRLQLRAQWVESDQPIVFTTANDLSGQIASHRRQVGVGVEFKF